MAYKNAKKGWYKLQNVSKFVKPSDSYMASFNEASSTVEYKSGLELKAFKYADANPLIVKWTVEPFAIKYISPKDNRVHRYYIDMLLVFSNGKKFLVEIKSINETKPPKAPKKITTKSTNNYKKAIATWTVNSAKWSAAKKFCSDNGFNFIMLTEQQLN